MYTKQRASQTWRQIESALADTDASLPSRLPSGVTEAQLESVERELGKRLPILVREIYLVHNGFGVPAYDARRCQNSTDLLALDDALTLWRELRGELERGTFADFAPVPIGPVQPSWWSIDWFPISQDGAGNHHCVDLGPLGAGALGQVVTFWHDDADRTVVAEDLAGHLLDLDFEEIAIALKRLRAS